MGDEEHRLARGRPHAQDELLDRFPGQRVERAEGFVHQQQARVGGERPREAHALLHPAGKLEHRAGLEPLEADERQAVARGGAALRLCDAAQFEAEGGVVDHVEPRQQGVLLEHHAAVGAGAGDGGAVEADLPLGGADEPRH